MAGVRFIEVVFSIPPASNEWALGLGSVDDCMILMQDASGLIGLAGLAGLLTAGTKRVGGMTTYMRYSYAEEMILLKCFLDRRNCMRSDDLHYKRFLE